MGTKLPQNISMHSLVEKHNSRSKANITREPFNIEILYFVNLSYSSKIKGILFEGNKVVTSFVKRLIVLVFIKLYL